MEGIAKYIYKCYPRPIKSIIVKKEYIVLYVRKEHINNYLKFLNIHCNAKFELLLDIWGVDYPEEVCRYEVNYWLLSIRYNMRLLIKINTEEYLHVQSVANFYQSAGWLEREVFDMYGVFFEGNEDLRRILTDYGFEGYPLRKDFPLMGFVEVRYDEGYKRVIIEPIEMSQEYRMFEFESPWEERSV
jgi:NADH/F420H2 dehydrogenase subunit C